MPRISNWAKSSGGSLALSSGCILTTRKLIDHPNTEGCKVLDGNEQSRLVKRGETEAIHTRKAIVLRLITGVPGRPPERLIIPPNIKIGQPKRLAGASSLRTRSVLVAKTEFAPKAEARLPNRRRVNAADQATTAQTPIANPGFDASGAAAEKLKAAVEKLKARLANANNQIKSLQREISSLKEDLENRSNALEEEIGENAKLAERFDKMYVVEREGRRQAEARCTQIAQSSRKASVEKDDRIKKQLTALDRYKEEKQALATENARLREDLASATSPRSDAKSTSRFDQSEAQRQLDSAGQ